MILTHFISSSIKVAKAPSLSLLFLSLSLSLSLFFNHLYLELVGERKHKNNQVKIQFESKIRTSNQDYKNRGQKPDTKHWFKDLLEEDIGVESRPDTNHILAFTNKTNHQLPASSVTMLNICIKSRNLKGGIGSLFYPWPMVDMLVVSWGWVIVPLDLAPLFVAICAHYHYRVIHRAIIYMHAWFKPTQ